MTGAPDIILNVDDTEAIRYAKTRVLQAAGFEVHDPLDEWQRTERAERLRLPGDPLHYGPLGNERFGRFIAAGVTAPRL